MPLQALGIVVAMLAAMIAAMYLILWLLNRFVHRYAAIGAGALLIAYLAYNTVSGLSYCGEAPVYIPPDPGEVGEGAVIFNCDGPGGVFIYLTLWIIVPAMIIAVALSVYLIVRRKPRIVSQGEQGVGT